jgi:NitT/TauT family transport system permease protein
MSRQTQEAASWRGPIAVVAVALLLWDLGKRIFAVPDFLLPSPLAVAGAFWADPAPFVHGFFATFVSAAAGFLLAAALGVLLGSLLSWSRRLERSVYPLTLLFQMVPLIAIAPLLVVWFGYGRPATLASAVVVAVFPILANTLAGLRSADPLHEELFSVLAASRLQVWWKLRLPSAAPQILTGLRIAAGLSTIGTITGEFLAGVGGDGAPLGIQITTALKTLHVEAVFVCVLLAALVGFLLFFAVSLAARLLLRRYVR